MLGRVLLLVALCMAAQPVEARAKAKRVTAARLIVWNPTPAITAIKPLDGAPEWRLQPVSAPKVDAPTMRWRFTGSKVKMRLVF